MNMMAAKAAHERMLDLAGSDTRVALWTTRVSSTTGNVPQDSPVVQRFAVRHFRVDRYSTTSRTSRGVSTVPMAGMALIGP